MKIKYIKTQMTLILLLLKFKLKSLVRNFKSINEKLDVKKTVVIHVLRIKVLGYSLSLVGGKRT